MDIKEVLANKEAKEILEQIEELHDETETELVRIREKLISELKERFGYTYIR